MGLVIDDNEAAYRNYENTVAVAEFKQEQLERYIEENRADAILRWLDDEKEVMLASALCETKESSKAAEKVVKMFRAHVKHGKLNKPEYAELGIAFCELVLEFVDDEVRVELERDFDR